MDPSVAAGMSRGAPKRRRVQRVRLTPASDPLRSAPNLAALSDNEWIEYLVTHYPTRVVLDLVGVEQPANDRLRAVDKKLIKRALAPYSRSRVLDLIEVLDGIQRQSERDRPKVDPHPSRSELSGLTQEELRKYFRTHYPRLVFRELEGIEQSAADAGHVVDRPRRRVSARKKTKDAPAPRDNSLARLHRYVVHLMVITWGAALMSRNVAPLAAVAVLGLVAGLSLLLMKDGLSSVVAFTVRSRSKTRSVEVTVRVKTSSWGSTTTARVLSLASILLPPEYRAEYVEEQYANLVLTDSQSEWFEYLIDLILELPRVAWQFYSERKRESSK